MWWKQLIKTIALLLIFWAFAEPLFDLASYKNVGFNTEYGAWLFLVLSTSWVLLIGIKLWLGYFNKMHRLKLPEEKRYLSNSDKYEMDLIYIIMVLLLITSAIALFRFPYLFRYIIL